MLWILLLVLLLLAVAGAPHWPYWGSGYYASWGYYPSGGLGVVIIVLLVLLLMGRL